MYRHPFDAISFFFGLLFIAGALSAIFVDDPWPFDRGGLWAIMLIVGGLALLIAAVRPGADRRPVAVTDPTQTSAVATDPLLSQARREVDEYVDQTVPSVSATDDATPTSDDAATAPDELVTAEAVPDDVVPDEAVTDELVADDAGAGPVDDGAATAQDGAGDGAPQVGGETETPDEANHAGP
jgi:hypothetical protein